MQGEGESPRQESSFQFGVACYVGQRCKGDEKGDKGDAGGEKNLRSTSGKDIQTRTSVRFVGSPRERERQVEERRKRRVERFEVERKLNAL